MHTLGSHPYMCFSLGLFVLALLALVLLSRQRSLMLLGGLLAVPYGALEFLFIPAYWMPRRITTLPLGPEDVLFSFSVGLIACQAAFHFRRHPLSWRLDVRSLLRRYVAITTAFLAGLFLFSRTDITVMTATLLSMLGVGVLLAVLRRDLWRVPLAGGSGFTALYFLMLLGAYSLWPQFASEWNSDGLWGPRLLGVPLEELTWALLYGGLYPLGIGYFLGVRHEPGPRPLPV